MDLNEAILKDVQRAIFDAVKQRLSGQYDNPLNKLIDAVVASHNAELSALLDSAFVAAIRSDEFKAAAKQEMAHKVAKVLMQKMEGAVEKAANTLRSDPACKARIIAAIEKIVQEHQPQI